jgi:hypothetical protein
MANIRFFKKKRLLPHSDPRLHLANTVSITFEHQKRDIKHDTITHHRSHDPLLCPVKIWSKIIKRLHSYSSSTPTTTVNTYKMPEGKLHLFTGPEILARLRLAAASIGQDELGFSPSQIGLHSARSGAAMAMYLAGVPIFTIMLLGRWSSDAFMRYIRKQVSEFSAGVSSKMTQNEAFFTIPLDPTRNPNQTHHPINKALLTKHGLNFKDALNPLISVFQ